MDLVDFICLVAAREWSADDRDLELHHAYTSALAVQNVWQPFMLAIGFFGQVSRILSGEIGAA